MKRFIAFMLVMFMSATVFAQNDQLASKASIEELLALTETKQSYDVAMLDMTKVVDMSTERFLRQVPSQNQAKFKKAMASFNTMLQEEMNWENTKQQYIQIYAETFTQQEINDLIAFYKTSSGKAFIKKSPLIHQKTSMIYQKKSMEIIDRFAKMVEESAGH